MATITVKGVVVMQRARTSLDSFSPLTSTFLVLKARNMVTTCMQKKFVSKLHCNLGEASHRRVCVANFNKVEYSYSIILFRKISTFYMSIQYIGTKHPDSLCTPIFVIFGSGVCKFQAGLKQPINWLTAEFSSMMVTLSLLNVPYFHFTWVWSF